MASQACSKALPDEITCHCNVHWGYIGLGPKGYIGIMEEKEESTIFHSLKTNMLERIATGCAQETPVSSQSNPRIVQRTLPIFLDSYLA